MVLAGFAVAVGVVVDDAIIDMENIVRRLRQWRAQGKRTTPLRLLLAASLEVRTAILYATLINIIAVVPVVLVGGLTASFFRPLAVAYAVAVLASMLVALTVTPALAMILMPSASLHSGDPPLVRWCKRGYAALLRPVLARPLWALATVAVLIAAGAVILPGLGQSLFPTFKEPDLLMHFDTKPGTSLPEMTRMVSRLQRALLKVPGVTHVGSHIGQALLGEEVAGPEFSEQWITLSPNANLPRTEAAVRAVGASFPGTFLDLTSYLHERIDETISSTSEDLVVRILGPNFGTLQRLAHEITGKLSGTPNLIDLHPQSQGFIAQIQETVNAPVAARYGLTPGQVRRQAATLLGTMEIGSIQANGITVDVQGYSIPSVRRNLSDVSELPINTPHGGHVPLGRVATLSVDSTPSDITRVDDTDKIDVLANVNGPNLGSVTAAVNAKLATVHLPLGYHLQLLGEAAERQAAQNRLLKMGLAAAFAILILLITAFMSLRLAALMFLTLPVALVGGVLAAWAAIGTISLGALVGFFAVLGIAARNGILMISHLQHLEREEGEPFGAGLVMRGAQERLSPILMTALATGLALVPLAWAGNKPGHEIEHPMAIVILGGLVTSTVLNLGLMPALYLAFGKAGGRPEDEEFDTFDAAARRGEWVEKPAPAGAHGSVPVHANPGE
jgi:Cu/Ag efflux pump CusA